jgi:hypothetical protein
VVAASKPQVVKFKVAPGARIRRGDVDEVGRTLQKLQAQGKLTAEAVLAEAENPKSVLHRYIEWSDEAAAHAYRLEQARRIIRAVEVVIENAKGKSVAMRGFFSVKDAAGVRGYEPMQYVFSDTAMSDQVMRDAKAQLEGWMKRYKTYEWARTAIPQIAAALKALKKPTKKK